MLVPTVIRRSLGRLAGPLLAVAVLGALLASCAPTTPPPSDPIQQFCEFWDKVADAPPTNDNAVLVKDDVVALADETVVAGSDCAQPGASVQLDDAVLAEGEEVPSELGNLSSAPIAAITGPELAASGIVFENLSMTSLEAEVTRYGIAVRGSVAVRLSGVTSSMGFVGTLTDLRNWSVTLSSGALSIPGLTTAPAQFTGTLRSINGVPSLTLNAAVSSARIGDITVTGAAIAVAISPSSGVSASVQGNIEVGPSTAGGTVDVEFDRSGALVSAKADLAVHLVGFQSGGSVIDLQGTVKLDGNAQETVASFSGNGILGDLVINSANGSMILEQDVATFAGVLDIQQGETYVRFNGSIVFDGNIAYTPYLTLEAGGEFSGTLNDGQVVSVSGALSTEVIGGQIRTVVTGDFKVGTLAASGSAIVESDGSTTTLDVTADLVGAGFDASLSGVVVLVDGRADLVNLDVVVDADFTVGDVTVRNGTLQIRSSFATPLRIDLSGGVTVGTQVDLAGSVSASFGPGGSLVRLEGSMSGTLRLDGFDIRNMAATVVVTPEQVNVVGSGGLFLTSFPLELRFEGSYTSSAQNPNWLFRGSGGLRIGPIDVASANFELRPGTGLRSFRVGFYYTLLIFPAYFEATFHMAPSGGCEKVDLTAGEPIGRAILAGVLPGVIGCPVNN